MWITKFRARSLSIFYRIEHWYRMWITKFHARYWTLTRIFLHLFSIKFKIVIARELPSFALDILLWHIFFTSVFYLSSIKLKIGILCELRREMYFISILNITSFYKIVACLKFFRVLVLKNFQLKKKEDFQLRFESRFVCQTRISMHVNSFQSVDNRTVGVWSTPSLEGKYSSRELVSQPQLSNGDSNCATWCWHVYIEARACSASHNGWKNPTGGIGRTRGKQGDEETRWRETVEKPALSFDRWTADLRVTPVENSSSPSNDTYTHAQPAWTRRGPLRKTFAHVHAIPRMIP